MTTRLDADLGAELITELLDRGECVQFVARGRSMWPFIMDGDTVCIDPRLDELAIGDVVLASLSAVGPLHRLVAGPRDGRYLLRGDALPNVDGWVDRGQILGRLVARSRDGRSLRLYRGRSAVFASSCLGYTRGILSRFRHGILGRRA